MNDLVLNPEQLATGAAPGQWYPVDVDALAECVPNDERSFLIATDSCTCEQLWATRHPCTQTMFLPGVCISPRAALLPPFVPWSEYTAQIIVTVVSGYDPDEYSHHQVNELSRYLKRSGVGSVKVGRAEL